MAGPDYHWWTHHPRGPDGLPVLYHIRVYDPLTPLVTGDDAGAGPFMIDDDIAGLKLIWVRAYVNTESSSGGIEIQVRNATQAADLLSTPITIEAGDLSSRTSFSPWVLDPTNPPLELDDFIAFDVDDAGTDALGLGMSLLFGRRPADT